MTLFSNSNFFSNLLGNDSDKRKFDLSLLIIFVIVAQHSFLVKIFGLALIVFLNFKVIKNINVRKIPLFYTILPSLEVLKFFLVRPDFSQGHFAQFAVGICYWVASLILCWVMFERVRANDFKTVNNSIKIFAVLNCLFSLGQFIVICIHEGVLNPYNTGNHHPYGVSSGDMINGLLQGVHLTNAFVSILLVLYFTDRKDYLFMCINLLPLLLCGSNYGSIVLIVCLGIYFLVSNKKGYAFIASVCITVTLVLFYIFVTPINAQHTITKVENLIGNKLIVDEQYQQEVDKKSKLLLNKSNNLDSVQNRDEVEAINRLKKTQSIIQYDFNAQSGKKASYQQTLAFLKSSPLNFLLGAGIGGFSSNIAFNFSGAVDNSAMNRYFPTYESPYFGNNHKSIYEFMKVSHMVFHSESNRPFSVYNQLLGEYGVLGMLIFVVFYLFYFLRKAALNNYALPIIVALLMAFNLNYFFESLSIVLFFEVLMFLNIREKSAHGKH